MDVKVKWASHSDWLGAMRGVRVTLSASFLDSPIVQYVDLHDDGTSTNTEVGTVTFNNLQPGKTYSVEALARQLNALALEFSLFLGWHPYFSGLWETVTIQ